MSASSMATYLISTAGLGEDSDFAFSCQMIAQRMWGAQGSPSGEDETDFNHITAEQPRSLEGCHTIEEAEP